MLKTLNSEENGNGINGWQIFYIRFTDNIVIITNDLMQLNEMLTDLKTASVRIDGLSMNMDKAKKMKLKLKVKSQKSSAIHISGASN